MGKFVGGNALAAKRAKAILRRHKRKGCLRAAKALATLLDAMGNTSFCGIARPLGVSAVAILKWIRQEAAS